MREGQMIGQLLLVEKRKLYGKAAWLCLCICGVSKVIKEGNLKDTKSRPANKTCGSRTCMNTFGKFSQSGASSRAEYNSWSAAIKRCHEPKNSGYKTYGAKGITVDERWLGPDGFANFLADMGPKPSRYHSLDRIDNSLGYTAENCRWATPRTQAQNKETALMLEYQGQRKALSEWCRTFDIPYNTAYNRYKAGMTADQILSKSSVKMSITWRGETMLASEWARRLDISTTTLYKRIKDGVSPVAALEEFYERQCILSRFKMRKLNGKLRKSVIQFKGRTTRQVRRIKNSGSFAVTSKFRSAL